MRCYVPRPTALTSAGKQVIKDLLKEEIALQSDAIAARCYNEVWCAMLQADLSPKTIARVQKALAEAVLPKYDSLSVPENKKNFDNTQNVADADLWVKDYLTAHNVNVWAVQEINYDGI